MGPGLTARPGIATADPNGLASQTKTGYGRPMKSRKLLFLAGGGLFVLILAVVLVLTLGPGGSNAPVGGARETAANETAPAGDDLWSGFGQTSEPPTGLLPPGTQAGDTPPASPITLAAIRDDQPDNLYWKMLAPTDNPDTLKEREREKTRLNEQYGKVLSNTASPVEIRAYYDYRKRLSADYIRLLQHLLKKYDGELTDQQEGLFKLGIEMHAARIAQTDDDVQRALDRKEEYDRRKAAWQANKN